MTINIATKEDREFKVYMKNINEPGKTYITSVFFHKNFTAKEVKKVLVYNNNFSDNIIVRKYTK